MSEDRESRQQRRARERAEAKRGGYDWPRVTVIHPEHGSYEMDVHGLQAPNGHIVLAAFLGKDGNTQVNLVNDVAKNMGYPIVPLVAENITEDIGLRLAAQFHATPDSHVVLMEVEFAAQGAS